MVKIIMMVKMMVKIKSMRRIAFFTLFVPLAASFNLNHAGHGLFRMKFNSNHLAKTRHCSLEMSARPENCIGIHLITAASLALFFGDFAATAFVPDLSGSPLKSAKPSIVVQGSARVVDGTNSVWYEFWVNIMCLSCDLLSTFAQEIRLLSKLKMV
jgi:hypothetical protein